MDQEVDQKDETAKVEAKPELDVAAVMAKMEQMEATNDRLLEESKAWKSKYQNLSGDVDKKNQLKLEEEENWKDLLEIEKNKRSEYEAKLRETKKAVLQKELAFQVSSAAKDAYDVTDVINSLPKNLLSIDEDELKIEGIAEAVNTVRDSKPHLFNNKRSAGMASGRPEASSGKKTYDDMSDVEKELLFKDALSSLV